MRGGQRILSSDYMVTPTRLPKQLGSMSAASTRHIDRSSYEPELLLR